MEKEPKKILVPVTKQAVSEVKKKKRATLVTIEEIVDLITEMTEGKQSLELPCVITIRVIEKKMVDYKLSDLNMGPELFRSFENVIRKKIKQLFKLSQKQKWFALPGAPLSAAGIRILRKGCSRLQGEQLMQVLNMQTDEQAKEALPRSGHPVVGLLVLEPRYLPPIMEAWLRQRVTAGDGVYREVVRALTAVNPDLIVSESSDLLDRFQRLIDDDEIPDIDDDEIPEE